MSITSAIKSIQKIMRKDVGVDGDAQRLSQLVWMLFLKIFDDREVEWELLQDNYKSPLPEKYRWRNWAANSEGMTGDELKQFLDNDMFPALQNLEAIGGDQRAYVIRSVFEDAYNYMKSGQLIRQVVNKIQQSVDFNKAQERHLFGDMYEQLLRDLQAAGNAGEFYTPRAVTEFMVRMVNPRLGEKLMDPACGTGGFLTSSIEHIRNQDVKTVEDESILQGSIFGVEKKPMPHLLCTTNMILHGIDVPSNIRHDNTLARPLISWGPAERVDVIVTNPPFGGNEEEGIETNFPSAFRTKETADLFLVLIMQLLKPGGRAALVLPDGFMFGEGIKTRIKEKLLEECNLHTIIRLPNNVFSPYTDIRSNLLFFTKGEPTKDIWFYEHPYPAGVSSYSKTRPMKLEEFQSEQDWWGDEKNGFKTRKENECAWKVNISELKARNFNLDLKNPHITEQLDHDPEGVLKQYDLIGHEIKSLRSRLKLVLMEALQLSKDENSGKRLLIENLDIWTGADAEKKVSRSSGALGSRSVYGVEKLKGLVLDLAFRGRLVSQSQNDDLVSDLLLKIQNEKIRLGAGKKSKKSLSSEENAPKFNLPSNWQWARFEDICSYIQRGKGPIYSDTPGFIVISQKCVRWPGLDLLQARFADISSLEKYEDVRMLQEGDVLWNSTGTGTIGRACSVPGLEDGIKMVADSHVTVIRPIFVLSQFVLRWIQSPTIQSKIEDMASGTTNQIELNTSTVLGQYIPLPPLQEQARIVNKINELMVLCDQLQLAIIKSNHFQQNLADVLVKQAVAQ